MTFFSQAPRQHDVPVEHTSRGVGDRVLLVIAFGQNDVERGDRTAALLGVSGLLHQYWQFGEYRRLINLVRWQFADGQVDYPMGLGETGQRIHEQQDILALVAEILGDARAVHRGAQAHQRRIVRRRGNDHRTLEAFFTEDVLDEFLNFTTPLA